MLIGNPHRRRWPGKLAILLGLALIAASSVMSLLPGVALGDNPNAGDVWLQPVGQGADFPGHQHIPHFENCDDINLWGNGMTEASGEYTIDSIPPTSDGGFDQVYPTDSTSEPWTYDTAAGGNQVMSVVDTEILVANAISAGAVAHEQQGYHFKLQYQQNPQKHKVFWVKCEPEELTVEEVLPATVVAHKFSDTDGNGSQGAGEADLSGWGMSLFNGGACADSPLASGSTGSDGNHTLKNDLAAGTYSVRETEQEGWQATTAVCQSVTVAAGETKTVNFGNRVVQVTTPTTPTIPTAVLGEKITQTQVLGEKITALPKTGIESTRTLLALAGIFLLIGGLALSAASRREGSVFLFTS